MISQFALRLLCGMGLVWLLLPRRLITAGFFRIQMLVALGLSVLAAMSIPADSPSLARVLPSADAARVGCVVIAGLCYVGSVLWTLDRRPAGTAVIAAIAGLAVATLLGRALDGSMAGATPALLVASEFSTALVMGSATTGMLLGHWYLTAPMMSLEPLQRANLIFGASAILRLIVSAVGLSLVNGEALGGTRLLWLALRWSAGIAGPLLLAAMVWRILKYRNTQAATGVLFVGVILTFIGELSATLVSRELGWPL